MYNTVDGKTISKATVNIRDTATKLAAFFPFFASVKVLKMYLKQGVCWDAFYS